ncbi:toxin glutamine deamidase domain-containing protein [Hamadaea sp. NPDC051192]|uniref:toxin glutamine deamidase domain-containing protein n=1 Tax=Hamadaea sp. NPDC051192 TaxID=3154940 RepID=UPI0034343808
MLLRVPADGVPIDCGGVADGLTGCYGKLPAIGIATVAAIAVAAVIGHAVLAVLMPQLFNRLTGVPEAGSPDPDVLAGSADSANQQWRGEASTTVRGGTYFTPSPPGLKDLINPGGGTVNCRACALALDFTLAGAPATALPGIAAGPHDFLETHFSGSKFHKVIGLSGVVEAMAKAGPGARGIVYAATASNGHVWNVVNDNGEIVFLDGQNGVADHVSTWRYYELLLTT